MEITTTLITSDQSLLRTIECQALALSTWTNLCNIVETKHHILRRNGDRRTISRVQNVVALEHQDLSLQDSLVAQWKVNSHLVTIEVGIERCTCQWVQLDSLTLDHLRLECLDTETVKCRGTVQHNRMTLHHILQNIPDNWLTTINNLLGTLDSLYDTTLNQLTDDEWFVKLCSHQLWKTALAHLQLRTYNDYRTSRVVNTLTQQVLTETSLLTLQRIRERLQRTIALALYSRTLA